MTHSIQVSCVVMASGYSKRYGTNKLLETFNGKKLIQWAFDAIPNHVFCDVTIVTQYSEIRKLAEKYNYRVIENENANVGISNSVKLGTEACIHSDGILFMVGDQPLLKSETLTAMTEQFRVHPDHIVAISSNGKRGNPCIFPSALFNELLQIEGDRGGSSVIRRHEDLLELVETSAAELADIDTIDDMRKAFA